MKEIGPNFLGTTPLIKFGKCGENGGGLDTFLGKLGNKDFLRGWEFVY